MTDDNDCPNRPKMADILGRPLRERPIEEHEWRLIHDAYIEHAKTCENHDCLRFLGAQ